jgi:putative serine protease PepD
MTDDNRPANPGPDADWFGKTPGDPGAVPAQRTPSGDEPGNEWFGATVNEADTSGQASGSGSGETGATQPATGSTQGPDQAAVSGPPAGAAESAQAGQSGLPWGEHLTPASAEAPGHPGATRHEWAAPPADPSASPGQGTWTGQSAGSSGAAQAVGQPGGAWAAGTPTLPAPQHSEWARPVHELAGERVVYGSAAGGGGATPPTGHYLPAPGQPPRAPQPARRGSGALVAGVATLALLVGGGAGALGGYLVADSTASAPVSNALDQKKPAEQTSSAPAGSVEAVAEKVSPSVVQLQVQSGSSAGEGSGFILSSDGLILTNNHVVESAAGGGKITAVFADGSSATATIVGRDPTSDVAVVKAEGRTGLPIVELGNSDSLKVGQGVVAIGSPFELSGTVTSGIVSSLHRPTRAGGEDGSQATVMDAIQTDAAINPGNSGGPLVNMQGQVVGINSAIYSPQTANGQAGSVGIGFSIPIDQARRTAREISETGKATQTVLGVSVRDNQDGGALIAEVVAGGAGEQAGLKAGDVITKLDDRRIDTSDALVAAVRSHAPGDKVRLELGNGSRTVEATLAGQTVETE